MKLRAGRVAVAMSGGVDSSVAALLLLREGREVMGLHMSVWPGEARGAGEARAVCELLGIPFRHFDLAAEFRDLVLEDYRREYLAGRTPNPCVRCNRHVKFGLLVERAREAGIGADLFATGHYARIDRDPLSGRRLLRKGVDPRKDQSYFLYRLTQEELARTVLPLGGMRKAEVRAVASEAGLPVAAKSESQDLSCVDRPGLIGLEDAPGPIVDSSGRLLGTHRGIWHYTRGQRRGLGVASGLPLYVVDIVAAENTVVIGSREEACSRGLTARDLAWTSVPGLGAPRRLAVRIRSTHVERPALVAPSGPDLVRVDFDEPELAVAPGQSAVFYDGDLVLGGGVIEKAIR